MLHLLNLLNDSCCTTAAGHQCFDVGTCTNLQNSSQVCQCDDSNALPAYCCGKCREGYRFYNGTCIPSTCDENCSMRGDCQLFQNHQFSCQCFLNYDIQTNCKKCLNNFNSSQNCLVCNDGYELNNDNICVIQELSVSDISILVVGITCTVLIISGGIFWGVQRRKRFKVVGVTEQETYG